MPNRRKKLRRITRGFRNYWGYFASGLLLALILGYIFFSNSSSPTPSISGHELSAKLKSRVASMLRYKSSEAVAKWLQAKTQAEKVALIKNRENHYFLKITKRENVFRISAIKGFLLSNSGCIYKGTDNPSLVNLRGVLKAKKYELDTKGCLKTTVEEATLVRGALRIESLLKTKQIKTGELSYVRGRGFTFVWNKHHVILGTKPTKGQINKLLKVVKKIKNSSNYAYRIELDYQGKAFIKPLKSVKIAKEQ